MPRSGWSPEAFGDTRPSHRCIACRKLGYYTRKADLVNRPDEDLADCGYCARRLPVRLLYVISERGALLCKECDFWRGTRRRYKAQREQIEALLAEQGGVCANRGHTVPLTFTRIVDGTLHPGNTHIDHDHDTGEVRFLLCGPCNTSLGRFGDDHTAAAPLRGLADLADSMSPTSAPLVGTSSTTVSDERLLYWYGESST